MPNATALRDKLYERLQPSGWAGLLKGFLLSSDFLEIVQSLQGQVLDNKRFTPPLRQVFRAFEECPLEKLCCVIVVPEPASGLGASDGIPLSNLNSQRVQGGQRLVYEALSLEGKDPGTWSADLKDWSRQGVLLLHMALTAQIDKPGKHYGIWDPFLTYLVDMLLARTPDLPWVLMGNHSLEMTGLLEIENIVAVTPHPTAGLYLTPPRWPYGHVFTQINERLITKGLTPVAW
jgi:uracil-DNA glycosylase